MSLGVGLTPSRSRALRWLGALGVILAAMGGGAAASAATTYYASTTGSSSNSGLSTSSPWSLSYALAHAAAGSTIIVLPGTYSGDWEINTPLTVRSQTKWGARLINMPYGLILGYSSDASGTVVDGFEIAYSARENVDLYSPNCTIRNCWIHDAGINSRPYNTADVNSGVHSLEVNGTTVEYCLLENNGSSGGYDHGIYISGANLTVRGNVMRGNWGFGLCLYNTYGGSVSNAKVYNNLIYGNGINTVNNWDGSYVVPRDGSTCYLWNNTIIATHGAPIQGAYGTVCMTNNLILGPSGSMFSLVGQTVLADYNLSTARLTYAGPHDVVSSAANFVNASSGLYWLTGTSPARNRANPNILSPADFFGVAQTSVTDIGAVQYNSAYTADTRVLDPTPAGGADYWKLLGSATPPPSGGSSGTNSTGSGSVTNGLTFPASSGVLTAPFVLTNGYVCQFVDTENADGGQAVYSFTLTNAGTYVVSAVVNAPNGSQNSFYVTMDNIPASEPYTVWDVPVTSGFQSETVAWRGNGTWDADAFAPKAFALAAGPHKLIIIGREPNTQLQSLQIQPAQLTAPASAPVLRVVPGQ